MAVTLAIGTSALGHLRVNARQLQRGEFDQSRDYDRQYWASS